MVVTYNTLEGQLSVRGIGSGTRSGTVDSIAIVGGYDSANADPDVTAGKATLIEDTTNPEELFGDSEISRAVKAATANGVGTLWGIPVPETQTTESFTSTQSITLANSPIFNPEVHPDHSVTITDTTNSSSVTVNVVYDSPPATPSDADTANLNPITGEIEIDASSDYDVTYTYGDYQTPIGNAVNLPIRGIYVGTESPSVKATFVSELSSVANDFDFLRGFVGAKPEIASADISNYKPDEENWRIVEVAPALATGADGKVRTASAIAGKFASQPLGPNGSMLFDTLNGIESYNTEYRGSEAEAFTGKGSTDGGVTSVTRFGKIATSETTSTTEQFRLIYATEIVDDVAYDLFQAAEEYAGTPQDIDELRAILQRVCQSKSQGNPPLLGFGRDRNDDPYDVTTNLDANDPGIANATVTIVPHPIAEKVNIDMNVTDTFVQLNSLS